MIKVGDCVRVTKRLHGHEFKIGELVIVKTIDDSGNKDTSHGCRGAHNHWWMNDDEFEVIASAESQYKAGDCVRVIDKINGHMFEIGELVIVVEVCGIDDYECYGSSRRQWLLSGDEIELAASKDSK